MRLSSQNNQFIFNLPENFVSRKLEDKFQVLMDKNFIPYNSVGDYINATIKDIVFPSLSFGSVEQELYHGKKINFREAGNVMDKYQSELDVTFRSVDSHLSYFIIMNVLTDFYMGKDNYLDHLSISVLDKDGDLIYTIVLKDVIYKSLSELRMAYYATDFNEQTFVIQFSYNFIDIVWELDDDDLTQGKSNFDLDLDEGDPRDINGLVKEMEERLKPKK